MGKLTISFGFGSPARRTFIEGYVRKSIQKKHCNVMIYNAKLYNMKVYKETIMELKL